MSNWITYIDRLRPHTHRQAESGLRRTARHASATSAAPYQAPYDHSMSDRHRPTLSTR